jgi:magnesium-transporting ATPase (P-type)
MLSLAATALCNVAMPLQLHASVLSIHLELFSTNTIASTDTSSLCVLCHYAQQYFGYEFMDRVNATAVIKKTRMQCPDPSARPAAVVTAAAVGVSTTGTFFPAAGASTLQQYEILHILPFNSDRKRMSLICACPDGAIRLYCKGADTTMLPRLRSSSSSSSSSDDVTATVQHMDAFAQEGLRTLVVAVAVLDDATYLEWADKYEAVSTDLDEIAKKVRVRYITYMW